MAVVLTLPVQVGPPRGTAPVPISPEHGEGWGQEWALCAARGTMRAHTGDDNKGDGCPSPPAEMAPATPWPCPSVAPSSHRAPRDAAQLRASQGLVIFFGELLALPAPPVPGQEWGAVAADLLTPAGRGQQARCTKPCHSIRAGAAGT